MSLVLPLLPGILAAALLAGLGWAVRVHKAYWLIAGYNTMSEEKRRNVDVEGLGRFLGMGLFIGSGIIAVALVLFALGLSWGGAILLFLLLPGVVWLLVGAQRFDRNALNADGSINIKTKVVLAAVSLVMVGAGVFVAILLSQSARPATYEIARGALKIQCVFGTDVPLDRIKGLELAQSMPAVQERTGGSALGESLKGSFWLAGGVSARLYLQNTNPPFLHFVADGSEYYINRDTASDTKALYDALGVALTK